MTPLLLTGSGSEVIKCIYLWIVTIVAVSDAVLQHSVPLLLLLLRHHAEVVVTGVWMPQDEGELGRTLDKRTAAHFGLDIYNKSTVNSCKQPTSMINHLFVHVFLTDCYTVDFHIFSVCPSLTWQAGIDQLYVLLHRGQGLVPSTVDGYFWVQSPFMCLLERLANTLSCFNASVQITEPDGNLVKWEGTHCFALMEADGVAVWHGYEAIPPLPILLQVLKQTPREDGAARQRVLKHHSYY